MLMLRNSTTLRMMASILFASFYTQALSMQVAFTLTQLKKETPALLSQLSATIRKSASGSFLLILREELRVTSAFLSSLSSKDQAYSWVVEDQQSPHSMTKTC